MRLRMVHHNNGCTGSRRAMKPAISAREILLLPTNKLKHRAHFIMECWAIMSNLEPQTDTQHYYHEKTAAGSANAVRQLFIQPGYHHHQRHCRCGKTLRPTI